jgi:two-component system sensor histidine kinase ChvG
VNSLALAMLAGGFFYLDSYRDRLLDQRVGQVAEQARLIAAASDAAPRETRIQLLGRLGAQTGLRLRVYPLRDSLPVPPGGTARASTAGPFGPPTYRLRDPEGQPWQRQAARTLDRIVNFVAGAAPLEPFEEPRPGLRERLA